MLEKKWNSITVKIENILGEFTTIFPDSPSDTTLKTRQAIKDGAEVIVAVGGDVTLNRVVNGFINDEGKVSQETVLGILPMGTGNDFCRTLDIPASLEEAVSIIKERRTVVVDVGQVSCRSLEGEPTFTHFINISSFGLTSEVIQSISDSSAMCFKELQYSLKGFKANLTYENQTIEIGLGNQKLQKVNVRMVVVAIGRFFGGNTEVAPTANYGDRKFCVETFFEIPFKDVVSNVPNVICNRPRSLEPSSVDKVATVSVNLEESDHDVHIEADGEIVGKLPAFYRLLNDQIKVIAPVI